MASPLEFSGNAADLLRSMGAAVPEQKPQSGLKESIQAKKKMDDEKAAAHSHSHAHGASCGEWTPLCPR